MNKSLNILCTALLLTGASSAFASSTDLTVTGIITPAACTPSLSGGGVVDFGKISAKDLNMTTQTRLEDRTVQLTVSCNAPTTFAVIPQDNRAGSSINRHGFGLGLIDGTEKLGRYFLLFANPVADVPSIMLTTYNDGLSWSILDDDLVAEPNRMVALGSFDGSRWAPHNVKDAVIDIKLETTIAPANSLTLTNEVQIDGSATLQIVYM
jgi:hypothetical protein